MEEEEERFSELQQNEAVLLSSTVATVQRSHLNMKSTVKAARAHERARAPALSLLIVGDRSTDRRRSRCS